MSNGLKPHWKPFLVTTIEHDSASGAEEKGIAPRKPWRPVTLRKTYLLALMTTTIGLIVIVQWLLLTSRRDQGILFADDINELTLRKSFSYLYLPTIISVIYSFLWTWVDLDVKRLEPFFQLSKPGGAIGDDSILLSYPLEFLITVPLIAFKKRHWMVLVASTIMIMIFWGLTPSQAGIFAVRTVTVREDVPGSYSNGYIPLSEQGNLTASYAQSVYNIAWLNESLPPFMTKDLALSPFKPSEPLSLTPNNTNYTSNTNMYSIDVSCEPATIWNSSGALQYNSSGGCTTGAPVFRPAGGSDQSKPFDTMYVGYQNQNGMASYYLSYQCNETFLHYFLVRWSKSTPAAIAAVNDTFEMDPKLANSTTLFCVPTYYQQRVSATVFLPSNEVLSVHPVGEKTSLPHNLFNISTFEWAMSSGQEQFPTRGDFPTIRYPDQLPRLLDMPLNLAFVPEMAPFAIATYPRPAEEYLEPETLRLSYQAAYRLLFARQLVDILQDDPAHSTNITGSRSFTTQAVVVVPGFAYATTILLVLLLLLGTGLLLMIMRRCNKLERDPSTVGSLMDILSGDHDTVSTFSTFGNSDTDEISKGLRETRFSLSRSSGSNGRVCLLREGGKGATDVSSTSSTSNHPDENPHESTRTTGVRPFEMKLVIGGVFLFLQIAALAVFAVLYFKAKTQHGLALPAKSTFVRQLVENYIPIVFATLVEPFWLVLNRLLGLLQPFEELRKGSAAAAKSLDVDYSSLPPQLLFVRAFRAGHFVLVLVCLMVLLANVLAVALSGLMYEGTVMLPTATSLAWTRAPRIRELNGTGIPFIGKVKPAWGGSMKSDQFYHEMSNLTAETPLPLWTDEKYAYLARNISGIKTGANVQFETLAFGAELDCQALEQQNYTLNFTRDGRSAALDIHLTNDSGSLTRCVNFEYNTDKDLRVLQDPQTGHVALELGSMLTNKQSDEKDLFCRQHVLFSWLRVDWKHVSGQVGTGPGVHYYQNRVMNITSRNETMLLCKPSIRIGPAEIIVDRDGGVQKLISENTTTTSNSQFFSSTEEDLKAQANQFLADTGITWHKDLYPSDYINYLIQKSTDDTTLLDPSLPVPSYEHAAQQLATVYQKLFAILIATNADLLFENSTEPSIVMGTEYHPETRILFSTPAFAVTLGILACYIVTTIFYYARRPWRVLPRMPSTVASNIAFFAGSQGFEEGAAAGVASGVDYRARFRWGYGSFRGADGKRYVGIEREPLVSVLGRKK